MRCIARLRNRPRSVLRMLSTRGVSACREAMPYSSSGCSLSVMLWCNARQNSSDNSPLQKVPEGLALHKISSTSQCRTVQISYKSVSGLCRGHGQAQSAQQHNTCHQVACLLATSRLLPADPPIEPSTERQWICRSHRFRSQCVTLSNISSSAPKRCEGDGAKA